VPASGLLGRAAQATAQTNPKNPTCPPRELGERCHVFDNVSHMLKTKQIGRPETKPLGAPQGSSRSRAKGQKRGRLVCAGERHTGQETGRIGYSPKRATAHKSKAAQQPRRLKPPQNKEALTYVRGHLIEDICRGVCHGGLRSSELLRTPGG